MRQLYALDYAVVAVNNVLFNTADGRGFSNDKVSPWVKGDAARHAGGCGRLDLQRIFACDLHNCGKPQAQFVLLGVNEARIVVLTGGFELRAFRSKKRSEFSGRGLMPGGFAVVSLDDALIA